MYKKINLTIALVILVSLSMFSQTEDTDTSIKKIQDKLTSYFFLERENINLHFNKTTFLTNETIWFKGYVVNRKTKQPFFNTTNVFAVVYDDKGSKIFEKLFFVDNGTFTGKFELNEKLHSGNYFIQVYTNWMNNFTEDESTIRKIDIINPVEGVFSETQNPDIETLELKLTPEGGSLIKGITNVIGLKLSDCFGKSPKNSEVQIQNNKGEILQTVKLNAFGIGKFEIIPTNKEIKAVCYFDTKKIETGLQTPSNTGIALEINSFTFLDKKIFKIKTNPETIKILENKKIYLAINQDDKNLILPLKLNSQNLEQVISILNENIFEGINTVRIIDNELKQWCERIIYLYPKKEKPINLLPNYKKNGKVNMVGYSEYANANLSISILPEETKAIEIEDNLFYSSTIKPYINDSFNEVNYYFTEPSRKKFYELDLVLLNQSKPKYEWKNIVSNPPKPNHSFDIGLTIKGTINKELKNKEDYKVRLYSNLDRILLLSDLNEKNEYVFENIAITDSTVVELSLLKSPEFNLVPSNFVTQVLNRNKHFIKPFYVPYFECKKPQVYEHSTLYDLPKYNGEIINLNDVVIKSKTKKTLVNENKFGNSYLRGYKIEENSTSNLLLFIEQNGFIVNRTSPGEVLITSRQVSSIFGERPTPEVFIDDIALPFTFAELDLIDMSEIDEIYINANAIVPTMRNKLGIIKIYRRKKISSKSVLKSTSFLIKQGFEMNTNFQNEDYENFASKGFKNYGIVDWNQTLLTDEKGNFLFEFQDANIKNYKVIIKGVTIDGQLIDKELDIVVE
ncbi:hypothetical protein WFZ85_01495 [Flavobacterium sp. j3]|uniref:MG2 domain-containing protein n=1 Tax=Flavobacterium aureirubrum TaxID=3133147 RepID=A0ABU9N5P8_9FLAO